MKRGIKKWLLKINSFDDLNMDQLNKIYTESSVENAPHFFPNEKDIYKAIQLYEEGFREYLKDDFYSQTGRTYWVWQEDNQWVSALRTTFIKDNLYYIEALETNPQYRKQGYAGKLLLTVIEAFKAKGAFELCDCVSKKNIASLKTHLKAGFSTVSDTGFDYLQNEYNDQDYGMSYKFPKNTV